MASEIIDATVTVRYGTEPGGLDTRYYPGDYDGTYADSNNGYVGSYVFTHPSVDLDSDTYNISLSGGSYPHSAGFILEADLSGSWIAAQPGAMGTVAVGLRQIDKTGGLSAGTVWFDGMGVTGFDGGEMQHTGSGDTVHYVSFPIDGATSVTMYVTTTLDGNANHDADLYIAHPSVGVWVDPPEPSSCQPGVPLHVHGPHFVEIQSDGSYVSQPYSEDVSSAFPVLLSTHTATVRVISTDTYWSNLGIPNLDGRLNAGRVHFVTA